MPQNPESVAALANRLHGVLDTSHLPRVEAGERPPRTWPTGTSFGEPFEDVQAIIVHVTAGWPRRGVARMFVQRIIGGAATAKRGFSGQHYLSYDGTVFQVFPEGKVVWHANQENRRALGCETGNLVNVSPPGTGPGPWNACWEALSRDANDIPPTGGKPGCKLYARRFGADQEILVAWWTTSRPSVPDAVLPEGNQFMLFSEAQYRSWVLLARYLAERWMVPRNFPFRPHLLRSRMTEPSASEMFRRLVDVDPLRAALVRRLERNPQINLPPPAPQGTYLTEAGLRQWYTNGVHVVDGKRLNRCWTALMETYRGFHGHGFSGALRGSDHNCPGAMFDWHRFAREVWDFWWFPFDLVPGVNPDDSPVPEGNRRDYGRRSGELQEYFFDSVPSFYYKRTVRGFFGVGDQVRRPTTSSRAATYSGYWHGGMHFELAAGTPIYAAANGQVVAVRFPRDLPGGVLASTRFVLLRHEVFHRTRSGGSRIDYDQTPSVVYSLYMHLGWPEGMDYENIVEANPDWLNTILVRKKEYDLGLQFQSSRPDAYWGVIPHGWRRDRDRYEQILTDLRAGRVAVFPEAEPLTPAGFTPPRPRSDGALRVALGDYLGIAGEYEDADRVIHFEVFSKEQIDADYFRGEQVNPSGAFYAPLVTEEVTRFIKQRAQVWEPRLFRQLLPEARAALFFNVALRFKSEWSLQESDLPGGVGWSQLEPLLWWRDVVAPMNRSAVAEAQLPVDANVWHYHPLGFMAWLNRVTWFSEWPKYRLVDADGTPVACPMRPPPRRRFLEGR